MVRYRLRSPLRWLSALTSGLLLFAVAGIVGVPWLMLAIPFVAGAFLIAPPLGIYRHDETPKPRTGIYLEAYDVSDAGRSGAGASRFRLVLVNPGDTPASDFRIRLLIPSNLAPPESRVRPIAGIRTGEIGRHWFIESVHDATAITFRAGRPSEPGAISCAPHSREELADLVVPAQSAPYDVALDYQVSGGSAKATLGQLRLVSTAEQQ